MKKEHIRKKKEAKWLASLPPVTSENADDYPIGNPYRKAWTNAEVDELLRAMKAHREANPVSEEDKQTMKEARERYLKESEETLYLIKKKQTRRLFFKSTHENRKHFGFQY